jgi:hypothetical protein
MEKEKQKRMVCHLKYKGQHYYFGNLKILTDNFSREELGIGYKTLANHFTKHSEFSNGYCSIRNVKLLQVTEIPKN